MPTTAPVSLIEGVEGIEAVQTEDGNYLLDGEPLKDGVGLTHASYGTYKLKVDPSDGGWHAVPIPAGVPLLAPGLTVETIAGTGQRLFGGDGRQAGQAHLASPFGVAVDSRGNVLIADTENHRIRRVSPTGVIATVAGTGLPGFSGDGGRALRARLSSPRGIAVGPRGQIFISDSGNNCIRVVRVDGTIETVVGGDRSESNAVAALSNPHAIALDQEGDLYIADAGNHRIRKVSNGVMVTIAGTGRLGYGGDGGPARQATLRFPKGVTIDARGIVYIADTGNNRIRRINLDGIIGTVMGTGNRGFRGDGGLAANAPVALPKGVLAAPDGSVYVSDSANHAVRKIHRDGVVFTVAGTGVSGSSRQGSGARRSKLSSPTGLAVDADGRLLIADTENHRVRSLEPGWNLLPTDALPVSGHVALGETGDWARLWRTNNKLYHEGEPINVGDWVFGWFGQAYRLEHHIGSGWSAEPIEIDYESRFPSILEAARRGSASAQRTVGVFYALGLGVEQDFLEGLRWLRLAAQQGHPGAEYWLGNMYRRGNGVPQNAVKAVEWYSLAARKGYDWAQYRLGRSYRYGEGIQQDFKQAVHWFRRAAMQDHSSAQDRLGDMFRTGRGVTESPRQAFEWYRFAATAGNPWAQVRLGRLLREGSGVASDAAEAVRWIRFAADRGHGFGQQELGWMYEFGRGIGASDREAVKWYRRAAVQRWPYAQWRLGLAYMRGAGTEQDYVGALVWLSLAEENGEERAAEDARTVRRRPESGTAGRGEFATCQMQGLRIQDLSVTGQLWSGHSSDSHSWCS